MKLADRMLARVGKTRQDVNPTSRSGRLFRRAGVQDSAELQRIKALPSRDWHEDIAGWQDTFTEALKRRGGTQRLLPAQAAALREAHDNGGALLMIQVGGGKTLTSFLLPEVMESERPLLMVPAGLKDKTEREWWGYQKNWKLPKIRIVSYEFLSNAKNAEYLLNYKPDLIVADEGHRAKDPKSAVKRRIDRLLEAFPYECCVVLMSGTVTTRRLHDYWHILKWTHGVDDMPMPADWAQMTEWSECIDVTAKAIKMGAGALVQLCTPEEARVAEIGGPEGLAAVRQAYQRRLTSTPGVISTVNQNDVNCSLYIDAVDTLGDDHALDNLFLEMRGSWETPDGHPFTQAVDMWRHARELACGFYYVWDPRPPREWLHARRAWFRFVRQVLKHSHVYDTPLQVANAALNGNLDTIVVEESEEDGPVAVDVFERWQGVKHTFKEKTVAKWVSDTTLKYAAAWMAKGPGIVWCEHAEFGLRLAEMTGRPYFGQKGLCSCGCGDFIEGASGAVIASVHANRQGRNLQETWNRNLVISELPNGGKWQQLLGRTHRFGQVKDEVTFEVAVSTIEQWAGMMNALRDAQYIFDTTGDPQKLLIADVTIASADEVAEKTEARWVKAVEANDGDDGDGGGRPKHWSE